VLRAPLFLLTSSDPLRQGTEQQLAGETARVRVRVSLSESRRASTTPTISVRPRRCFSQHTLCPSAPVAPGIGSEPVTSFAATVAVAVSADVSETLSLSVPLFRLLVPAPVDDGDDVGRYRTGTVLVSVWDSSEAIGLTLSPPSDAPPPQLACAQQAPQIYGQHGYTNPPFSSARSIFKSRRAPLPPPGVPTTPPPLLRDENEGGKSQPPGWSLDWFAHETNRRQVSSQEEGLFGVVQRFRLPWSLRAPTPTDFLELLRLSLFLVEMLSLSCPGVSMSKKAFDSGQLASCRCRWPVTLAAPRRRRTPCVCFVASTATQPGLCLLLLFLLLNSLDCCTLAL
jgi:hypothetical protein